ncbi:MAG: hypothetical protein ACI4HQ_09125 [Acetatifactor sp.]
MKNTLAFIIAVLLLTGCNAGNDITANQTSNTAAEFTDTAASEEISIDKPVKSEDKAFRANGRDISLEDKEWEAVLTAFRNLQQSEPALPKENGVIGDRLTISINGESHNIMQINGKNSSYISVDNRAEYFCTDELYDLFRKYCTYENKNEPNPEERLVGLSAECDEPTNPEEYLETARTVVKPWLDSLKSEKGRYRLSEYTFTDKLNENRTFHGDGYINGGREFVCYVGFDTPDEDEDTAFFASGTYDTFYHYYFGPGIFARFRWENGICTLIEYDVAFSMLTSDKLTDGLYGISQQEMKYKTFYDFINDKENVKSWLEKDYCSRLCAYRISHNVMMLSNGSILFMDIGNSSHPEYEGDFATTDMHQYFYDSEMDEKYSSPVDFIDGSGPVVMTYRNHFPIIYDDYNHDGNPDYAIRISSDDYGSTYDVRCMDINGTPWEDNTEVYVYGEFDESIRLQVYSGTSILRPDDNGNGGKTYQQEFLFSDKSNTCHDDVTEDGFTDYRMYSQKFYLPETLRCYSVEDSQIICYFWNNTDQRVTLEEGYEIQKRNGDKWDSVGARSINSLTIDGGKCAEVSFDVSSISSDEMSLYRIRVTADGEAVYGGFYYGTKRKACLDISADNYPNGVGSISFTVKNTGMSAVYLDSAALYYNGEKLYDIDVNDIGRIDSTSCHTITVTTDNICREFSAGEYTLEIGAGGTYFSANANVIAVPAERRFYFPQKVEASKDSKVIKIPLKNNIWNEETAVVHYLITMEVMKDGIWISTAYSNENTGKHRDSIEIEFGDTAELSFINCTFSKIGSMNLYTFLRYIQSIAQPKSGDLCRICIRINDSSNYSEYVYFEMP